MTQNHTRRSSRKLSERICALAAQMTAWTTPFDKVRGQQETCDRYRASWEQ